MELPRRSLLILALSLPAMAQTPVQLTWVASTTPNTVVRVYRGNSCQGPFVVVGQNIPAAGPWSTVIPSAPGTSVSFQITAVDTNNRESAPSNCATVTIPTVPPPTPPASPTGLTVTPITQASILEWDRNQQKIPREWMQEYCRDKFCLTGGFSY